MREGYTIGRFSLLRSHLWVGPGSTLRLPAGFCELVLVLSRFRVLGTGDGALRKQRARVEWIVDRIDNANRVETYEAEQGNLSFLLGLLFEFLTVFRIGLDPSVIGLGSLGTLHDRMDILVRRIELRLARKIKD